MFSSEFLRKKNIEELKNELSNLLYQKFNLSLQLSSKKLKKTHLIKLYKKNIARIKTIISEKKNKWKIEKKSKV